MSKYFNRAGADVTSKVIPSTVKGQGARYVSRNPCTRCGGLGGSDKWKHTGWTCFQCGGSGKGTETTPRCWTAEKLAELDAKAAVRAEKRAEEARRTAEVERARQRVQWAGWKEQHHEFLNAWAAYADRLAWADYARDIKGNVDDERPVSDGLVEWALRQIARLQQEDRLAASSQYVGEAGKRLRGVELTVTKRRIAVYAQSRFEQDLYVVLLTDSAGNVFKYFGSTPWNFGEVGETAVYDFTVKGHEEYQGVKQTVIQRAKQKEQAA